LKDRNVQHAVPKGGIVLWLDQNIKNIDILLQRMIAGFRRSGTFFSGQGVVL
jgi:hypothetical protein